MTVGGLAPRQYWAVPQHKQWTFQREPKCGDVPLSGTNRCGHDGVMNTRPFRLVALPASLLLLMSVAACGGAPGSSSDGGGPAESSAAEPGGEEPGSASSAAEPGGEPSDGDGYFSEPDPGLPTQEEFLARVEPMITALAPPNSTETRRAEEGDLVLFVEFESTDSYDALEAYYQEAISAAGFEPEGGPTDFPESSEYLFYHPDAPEFQGGVTIRGNQVTLAFLGIPPTN